MWHTFWGTNGTLNLLNSSGNWVDWSQWSPTANLAPKGMWHTVEYLFVMNNPVGASNGIARIWVDGNLAIDSNNIVYVSSKNLTQVSPDFDSFQFYPLRGTVNYRFDRDDTFRLGEIYISGK